MSAITLSPDPPSAGSNVTIGYTGTLPHTLRYRFKVGGVWGDWVDVEIKTSGALVAVPSNATRMQVEDPSGGALPRDVPC